MRVPGGRNIPGFAGNATGRHWSLGSTCDKHNLIYSHYVFSYNFPKLEGKTSSIKVHVRYPFLMQSCMVILLIYDTILYSRRLVGVKGEGPSAHYKTTYRDL